jgi:hypothetical protein
VFNTWRSVAFSLSARSLEIAVPSYGSGHVHAVDRRPNTDRGYNAERVGERISGFRFAQLMVFCYHLTSRYVAMFRFFFPCANLEKGPLARLELKDSVSRYLRGM